MLPWPPTNIRRFGGHNFENFIINCLGQLGLREKKPKLTLSPFFFLKNLSQVHSHGRIFLQMTWGKPWVSW